MLNLLRKNASSWIIKFLLSAIVIVFVFWGIGSYSQKQITEAAFVNGEPISIEEFNNAYMNSLEQMKKTFGENLNEDLIKAMDLKRQALNRLISYKLFLQEANKIGLRATNSEITEKIIKMPVFQNNGKFDKKIYFNLLQRSSISPAEFEKMQAEEIVMEKFKELIFSSIKLSDIEIEEWFKWENSKIKFDYVLFEPEKIELQANDEEIKTFYEQNKNNYIGEPKIKVQFIYFNPEKYKSKVQINDDEIKEYFEIHKDNFEKPKTIEARHILIRVAEDAPNSDVEKAHTKIIDILKMAKEEKQDFAELAKKYSEGPSKDNGGSIGEFKKEDMVPSFSDAAFALNAGEISEPVRTPFGWHIIKVEKVNEESIKTIEDSKQDIEKILKTEMSKNLAYDEAEATLELCYKGDDISKIAQAKNFEYHSTEFFTRQEPPKAIKDKAKFVSTAFNLPIMEISNIEDFDDGYYILQPIERQEGIIPELETIKEKVKNDFIQKKKAEAALKNSEEFLAELKKGESMEALCKKFNLTVKNSGFMKRGDAVPELGNETPLKDAAFSLSDKNKYPDAPIRGKQGYFVIEFKEKQESDMKELETERTKIVDSILIEKKIKMFDKLQAELKEKNKDKIKIKISLD
ncbi:MAG: SurA N-terminal domain-containing protein [Desulfobacterales bacterium]|nr:SurA N-terminal domain-containing protein [Desulfobacterales bacterium]